MPNICLFVIIEENDLGPGDDRYVTHYTNNHAPLYHAIRLITHVNLL